MSLTYCPLLVNYLPSLPSPYLPSSLTSSLTHHSFIHFSDAEHASGSVEELSGVWAHRCAENSDSDRSDSEDIQSSQSEPVPLSIGQPSSAHTADQLDSVENDLRVQQEIMDQFDPCKEVDKAAQQV